MIIGHISFSSQILRRVPTAVIQRRNDEESMPKIQQIHYSDGCIVNLMVGDVEGAIPYQRFASSFDFYHFPFRS